LRSEKVLGLFLGRNNLQIFSRALQEIHQGKIFADLSMKAIKSFYSFTEQKHNGNEARLSP
jgi:hypothetical protein